MKARILFGAGGFVFVLLVLYVLPPIVLEVILAVLCALAAYEFISPTSLVKNRYIVIISTAAAFLLGLTEISLLRASAAHGYIQRGIFIVLVVSLFGVLLKHHNKTRAEDIPCGIFGAVALPYLLLSLGRIFALEQGAFLVLIPLLAAWGSDTFALFAGMLFGRHKLAPVISPKKTVEGAVGGVLGAVFCMELFTFIMHQTVGIDLGYIQAAALGAAGSIIGQVGDLSFSIVKRKTGIKDYGSIFPGHGGVLDRFDSVLFVAPVIEYLLGIFRA